MNLEQQKSLYALLDAAIRLHKMSLIQGDAPFNGHSAIPNSVEDDINCEYCGIINLAEYTLSDIYADIIYDKFIATPAPLDVERLRWALAYLSGANSAPASTGFQRRDAGDYMGGVPTVDEFAAAIAAAYAEETP